jgi:hypothetical protein
MAWLPRLSAGWCLRFPILNFTSMGTSILGAQKRDVCVVRDEVVLAVTPQMQADELVGGGVVVLPNRERFQFVLAQKSLDHDY